MWLFLEMHRMRLRHVYCKIVVFKVFLIKLHENCNISSAIIHDQSALISTTELLFRDQNTNAQQQQSWRFVYKLTM